MEFRVEGSGFRANGYPGQVLGPYGRMYKPTRHSRDRGCGIQGYLAHTKQPPSPRTLLRP